MNFIFQGLRDFPNMDESDTIVSRKKVVSKKYDKNAESIFILPALELHFQTQQLHGNLFFFFI